MKQAIYIVEVMILLWVVLLWTLTVSQCPVCFVLCPSLWQLTGGGTFRRSGLVERSEVTEGMSLLEMALCVHLLATVRSHRPCTLHHDCFPSGPKSDIAS